MRDRPLPPYTPRSPVCPLRPQPPPPLQISSVHAARGDHAAAATTLMEALECSPESPELLTALGLLLARSGDSQRAFDFLGTSLLHEPRCPKAILAAGAIIQARQWALSKLT